MVCTAIKFGIMYSRIRISQNSFPNCIYIYFQSHSWNSVRNYIIPKGIMKTRFEPRPLRMSSWNKLHTLDLNSGPLPKQQVFSQWTTKARYQSFPQINISSIENYQGLSFLPIWYGRFVPSTGIFSWTALWGIYVSMLLVQCQNTYNWCRGTGFESWVKSLIFFHADILGRLGSNLVFMFLVGLHMWNLELRYS
jgi:hypothetical protein